MSLSAERSGVAARATAETNGAEAAAASKVRRPGEKGGWGMTGTIRRLTRRRQSPWLLALLGRARRGQATDDLHPDRAGGRHRAHGRHRGVGPRGPQVIRLVRLRQSVGADAGARAGPPPPAWRRAQPADPA